jgi:CheY-like chemotaxis protein
METKTVHIMLEEDDHVDVRIIKRALQKEKISNPIVVAKDGLEALAMLKGTEGIDRVPWPFLILLDLNMPRMNGFEFLQVIREDKTLHNNIVFVLTTSADDADKVKAYEHHIAGYLVKSQVGNDFMRLIKMLDHFMISVEFPPLADQA